MSTTGRASAVFACLVVVLAWPFRPAGAQATGVEPPVRLDSSQVPYPESAGGRASVVLDLLVGLEGRVTESRIVEGKEPFASAARDAAASWRFQPATRGGVPVAARIRVRVDFAAPQPGAATSGPPASPAASRAARPEPTVQEVTVHGVRPEPGRQEMSGGEVRQMPGAFGDAFRAIEALPGVTPLISGLPYFLVRGAPPGDTGYYIDGVRVPALFHLGVGAAVIHPGLIDKVDFYPGGYPARFGRFTGGILSGEVLPTPERPHYEASARLLDAGALASAPLDGGRGDVLASGRYGYPGPLLSLFAKDTSLAYWDYQTRVRWRTAAGDDLSAFLLGSYDSLSLRNSQGQWTQLLGLEFHRADLRWDHRTSAGGKVRVALTLGYDRSATGSVSTSTESTTPVSGPGMTGLNQNMPVPTQTSSQSTTSIESETVALRTEWSDRAGPDADVRVGADATLTPYRVTLPTDGTVAPFGNMTGSSASAFQQIDCDSSVYGELVWRPAARVELRPGFRVDAFTARYPVAGAPSAITGQPRAVGAVTPRIAADPRLAARWDLSPKLAWVAALGVAHQASNIPFPSPGLQFSELWRGLQSSFQYSTGAEVKLPAQFTATGDVFMHDYTGLVDYLDSCPAGEATCTFNGRSVGFELLVRRPLTERFTGWLSYTVSRTDRDAFYLGSWSRRLSEFDRTHVANLILAADLGKRWRAGARLLGYSGLPYSTLTGSVGPPNSREPPFFRVDLRIEKKWNALGGTLALVFEWLNAFLSKETIGTTCTSLAGSPGQLGQPPQCQPTQVGPITFPSVGLEAAW